MNKNFKCSKIGWKIFRNQFLGLLELKTLAIKKEIPRKTKQLEIFPNQKIYLILSPDELDN